MVINLKKGSYIIDKSKPKVSPSYKGTDQEEEDLLSSLAPLAKSLMEPALFLSGITGFGSQSDDNRTHWEMYLTHDTAGIEENRDLICCLYEAQNEDIIPQYFHAVTSRREIDISLHFKTFFNNLLHTPYHCYALSYCLAHSSDQFRLSITIRSFDDVSLVKTLVKGLEDHCTSTTPSVEYLEVVLNTFYGLIFRSAMFWLMEANFLHSIEYLNFKPYLLDMDLVLAFLESLVRLRSLTIHIESLRFLEQITPPTASLKWLVPLMSLSELRELKISIVYEYNIYDVPQLPADILYWLVEHRLTTFELNISLPFNTAYYYYDFHSPTDGMVDCLLKSVLKSNQITNLFLPNISRETMAGVHSILLHCPNLVELELVRTNLGYDGILYICSALRKNTSLTYLLIHDNNKLPVPGEDYSNNFTSFSFMETLALPDRSTCTDFLLELNSILQDNTTLEEMDIQSDVFLPLLANECRWTGIEQFNMGAVGSGRSPNIRRSYSSSDLTQPELICSWNYQLDVSDSPTEVDFKRLFSKRKKLSPIPTPTAPDTEVLQSFSGLDPRLKSCLGISHLDEEYVKRLRETYWGMLKKVSQLIYT